MAVFMGAYFEWDGYQNFLVAQDNGFTPHNRFVEGSIFGYENLDNLQTGLHDFLRYLKFGYGRAVDIASSHIRRGRLSRADAIKLCKGRDGAYPATYLGVPLPDILAQIDMTEDEFGDICERFTNKEVVAWASSDASFQHCFLTTTDASKAASSTQAAA